jgi:MFS family permease
MTLERTASDLPSGWKGILAIIAMVSGPAIVGMMLTIVLPLLPEMAKEVLGGRNVLIAMPTSGIVVGGIIAGPLIDRFSPRRIMLYMLVAFGIIGLSGMFLGGVPLLASRFLVGVISTCISASSTTLIGEFIPPERRSLVIGLQMSGSSLAGIAAMNISGQLADAFGWRLSFVLFPIIAAMIFVPGMLLIPASVRPAHDRESALAASANPFTALKSVGRVLGVMWPLYLVLFLLHATAYTPNSQSSFVLAADGVTSASLIARMLSINQAMIVTAALCYPITRSLLGSRWIPALFLALMTSGLILLGLSRDLIFVGLALGLLGLGNGTLFPHQSNLVLARAQPEYRGRAVGLMVSNQFLADSINPFFFPPLTQALGLHYAIVVIGLFAATGLVGALLYGSRSTNLPMPAAKSFGH